MYYRMILFTKIAEATPLYAGVLVVASGGCCGTEVTITVHTW